MMSIKKGLLINCLLFLAYTASSQQKSIISHQDFIGYFNPALNFSGDYSELSFVHRSQWEGFGPSVNTLFFKRPFSAGNLFSAVGATLQYEDLLFVSRSSFRAFTSLDVMNWKGIQTSVGIEQGIFLTDLKVGEFGLEELIDPEITQLDRLTTMYSRLGLGFAKGKFIWGFSLGIDDFQLFNDMNASIQSTFDLPNEKYKLRPIVLLRMSEIKKIQAESQIRITYDDRVSFTAGYRQKFGVFFQLGLQINKQIKTSYGTELPSETLSIFGLTHEVFVGGKFETADSKRIKEELDFKLKRDSINRLKIDSIRTARINAPDEDELDLGITEEPNISGPEDESSLDESTPTLVDGDVISFDELSDDPIDNTHVILDHIGFEKGLYLLKPYAFDELNRLASYIKHRKDLHIEIQGHTDDSGSSEHNHELSRRRALTVYNYLVSKGINPVRMNVVGYGEDLPLHPNNTDENRALNRRIEVVFIELDNK